MLAVVTTAVLTVGIVAAGAAAPAAATATIDTAITARAAATAITAEVADSATPAPAATCIADSAVSYTYDPATNSGAVTVATPKNSTGVLCSPLYLTATSWKYTKVDVWPQKLDVVQNQRIATPGTYQYSAAVSCGQGDIYLARDKSIVPTATLTGPQSWEKFLNQFAFAATTPGNTYVQQSTGCFGLVTPVAPAITTVSECATVGTVTPVATTGVVYSVQLDQKTGAYTVKARAADGYHFAGEKIVTFTGSVGARYDCVKEPKVGITVGKCYADGDHSSKNVYLLLDNRGSNTPVTFTGKGVNETVAANSTKQIEVASVWNAGGTITIEAAGQSFPINLPAFEDCGAVTKPSSAVAAAVCEYNPDGRAGLRSVAITFDNSLSNRSVDFTVRHFPEYSKTLKAGEVYTFTAANVRPIGGDFTIGAGAYSEDFAIAACPPIFLQAPQAKIMASCGVADVFLANDSDGRNQVRGHFMARIMVDGVLADMVRVESRGVTTKHYTFAEGSGEHAIRVMVDGERFAGTTVDSNCSLPVLADPSAQSCVDGEAGTGLIHVDINDKVIYKIDGVVATQAYTEVSAGSHTVTAELADPDTGYTLEGQTSFTDEVFVEPALDCGSLETHPLVTPTLSSADVTCTGAGSYTLDAVEGVVWNVNGAVVPAGTYRVTSPQTVDVVATTASSDYGFEQDAQTTWRLAFTAPIGCTEVSELGTLAFTGVGGDVGAIMLVGLLFLFAGAGIYSVGRVRTRKL